MEERLRDLRGMCEEAGARFRGKASHCPLHGGDNPNAFQLYDGGRRWHCFTRCPEGRNDGDARRFWELWRGEVIFPKVVPDDGTVRNNLRMKDGEEGWEERAGEFVAYARRCLGGEEGGARVREYLVKERGLKEETWEAYQLGLNPEDVRDEAVKWGLEEGKKIMLPRGIVIPRYFRGRLRGVKIRRPRVGEALEGYLRPTCGAKVGKFISVKGSQHGLFGYDTWLGYPDLLLVEGEWDCMLAWQEAAEVCDVGTLGSAGQRARVVEEMALYGYWKIVVVYDADAAGEAGRKKFGEVCRVVGVGPPDHDLSDYWKKGGDLRRFIELVVRRN